MKTTVDLPDDLLMEAKSMAVRRRTTLKAIVEHALRREIQEPKEGDPTTDSRYERNEIGFLVLKREPSERIRLADIRRIEELLDQEELRAVLTPKAVP
ncbi:MAG: hypothetical protein U1F77_18090 [Kiritimatiellia bacterium]